MQKIPLANKADIEIQNVNMSSLVPSSSVPPLSEIITVSVATLGGIIVFVGLLMEKIAERKNDKYSPPFFKPSKRLGESGWYVLMVGIFAEIVIAGVTAIDDWHTRQMAIKNAPENLPIKSMVAEVNLVISETNAPSSDDDQGSALFDGHLDLMNKDGSRIAVLSCNHFDDSSRQVSSDTNSIPTWLYSMSFIWPDTQVPYLFKSELDQRNQKDISAKMFDNQINGVMISVPAPHSESMHGTCILTINGDIQRNFLIPKQINEMFLIDTNHP
jgi:hypothetical protein